MENKECGTAKPLGICEKLFNVLHLNPTFRPLRRIAYPSQEPTTVKPASLPSVPSAVGDGPAPPTSKSSGSEYSSGATTTARQVSGKKVPEPKLSKVESEYLMIPLKVPSKVELPLPPPPAAAARGATATPSKKLSYIEPQPPPPSRLPTEKVPSSSGKSPAPTPPPDKAVSKTDSTRATVDSANPAPAAEVGHTRTRRNLNDKVDEYINRTINRLRTTSNVGGSSSTSK